MKIALASDHAGFFFKELLKAYLERKGFEVEDFGCYRKESCDYPDFAALAARSVSQKKNERAILVCGSGVGMSMAANKINGIRAALINSAELAKETREHHDSNVLCLGARKIPNGELIRIVDVWLATKFEGEKRHVIRIAKLMALEDE